MPTGAAASGDRERQSTIEDAYGYFSRRRVSRRLRFGRMTTTPGLSAPKTKSRSALKTLPGLLISAFFLWYTFKGISFAQIRALRMVSPLWRLTPPPRVMAGFVGEAPFTYRPVEFVPSPALL